jgi:predicted AlkP superfamily phosphohydrolase/phosphomutase
VLFPSWREGKGQAVTKVALIGLDGADRSWLEPALKLGLVPNLRARFGDALYPCRSTIPPVSATAWLALTTGGGAGRLGITDFFLHDVRRHRMQVRPATSDDVCLPYLWEQASEAGLSSLIVNLPLTYPAHPLKGALVAGFPGKLSQNSVFPPALWERLAGWQVDIRKGSVADDAELGGYCRQLGELEKQHAGFAAKMLGEVDYDLFMINLTLPDRLGHVAAPQLQELSRGNVHPHIKSALHALDAACAELFAALGDANIILVSDHGMGRMAKLLFCPDRWLVQEGYLRLSGAGPKSWLVALGLTREKWERLRGRRKRVGNDMSARPHPLSVDWKRSRAFSIPLYGNYFGIFLNRRKLMESGLVEGGKEAGDLCTELTTKLGGIEIDGFKPVVDIKRREELWSGPFLPLLPDLVVELAPGWGYDGARGPGNLAKPATDARSGDHDIMGIIAFAGKDFVQPDAGFSADITDVAPTLLYLMGLPLAPLEGRLLSEVLNPQLLEQSPPQTREIELRKKLPKSKSDQVKEITDQLKGLGYLS